MTKIFVLWQSEKIVAFVSDENVAEQWKNNGRNREVEKRNLYSGVEFLGMYGRWAGEAIPIKTWQ